MLPCLLPTRMMMTKYLGFRRIERIRIRTKSRTDESRVQYTTNTDDGQLMSRMEQTRSSLPEAHRVERRVWSSQQSSENKYLHKREEKRTKRARSPTGTQAFHRPELDIKIRWSSFASKLKYVSRIARALRMRSPQTPRLNGGSADFSPTAIAPISIF